MPAPFDPVTPYAEGWLDAGDGNRIYWNERGNPDGKPAVIVHGGPGVGHPQGTPKAFDPDRYRVVVFDQRGCGRSTPSASDPTTDLRSNTTQRLLDDMEHLRESLHIERWLVFGGSWGSTLALAYAQRHPARVSELIVTSVWMMDRRDVDWLYRGGLARIFPGQWADFTAGVDGGIVEWYVARLADADPRIRADAAARWGAWEDAALSLEPRARPQPYSDRADDALMTFARICSHYAAHNGFLDEGSLLGRAGRLAGIPGVIIHGRHDLSCPPDSAWRLAKLWPDAALHLVDDAGHQGGPTSSRHLYEAIAAFGDG